MADEEFTEAEQAYFDSAGEKTEGLFEKEASEQEAASATVPEETPSDEQAPADEQASEHAAEEVVTPEDEEGHQKTVPHAALHKERVRRKETETHLASLQEQLIRAEERLRMFDEMNKPEQPEDAEVPDPNEDPIAALEAATKRIDDLQSRLDGTQQQTQEAQRQAQITDYYRQDAQRLVAEKPEFADSYRFLMEGRHRELETIGVTDSAERARMIAQEEQSLVDTAIQRGASPAEMVYNIALARGFKPAAPASVETKAPETEKIEQIERGQRTAGATLTGAGGVSGEGLTVEALANMSEDEFAAVAEKLGEKKMRQFLGG